MVPESGRRDSVLGMQFGSALLAEAVEKVVVADRYGLSLRPLKCRMTEAGL